MNVASSPLHLMSMLGSMANVKNMTRSLGCCPANKPFNPLDYDVHPNTGCFPPEPLPKLPAPFSLWELALEKAQEVLCLGEDENEEALLKRPAGELWREQIRSWPVFDTAIFNGNIRYLQRAHMVVSFLTHFYVHSIPIAEGTKSIRIPRALAVPLVAVSQQLGTAPVMTFADTVLWNWELAEPSQPLSATNIRYVTLLSGTETERQFYASSGAIELKGVEMLQIIESFMSLPETIDVVSIAKISRDLAHLKEIIDEMTEIFRSIRDNVDPKTFHWRCRPWWVGAPGPNASEPVWVYEGVPQSALADVQGPSAGQSTVMHALDIFLDIDHKLAQRREPAPSAENKRADTGFMERMRRYMPGPHREYLARIAAAPRTMRDVAKSAPSLQEPYNAAVSALKRLRNVHIRIVCLYVVTQTHSNPPEDIVRRESGPARGTGGNEVSNLLKAGRDATDRALIRN